VWTDILNWTFEGTIKMDLAEVLSQVVIVCAL
jgi:hypothetical protein